MNILAIETSTLTGSVALCSVDQVIGELTLSVSVQHSERLMPAIDQLLFGGRYRSPPEPPICSSGSQRSLRSVGPNTDKSSIKTTIATCSTTSPLGRALSGCRLNRGLVSKSDPTDTHSLVDLIAVAKGPGSFTGLRIGIAAAQGLAMAWNKPIVGVSTLESLALNGLYFSGIIVPVLNAYRGEIYRGLYRGDSESLERLSDDRVVGIPEFIEEIRGLDQSILLLGNGMEICGKQVREALGTERIQSPPPPLRNPRASNVALIASQKWKSGFFQEPVLPRYLRKPG